jgi:dipeptidyl-peptidase-4
VLYPQAHLVGRRLPVILELADGPHRQRITLDGAGWQERQWWADAGYAVVSIDSRGTPGIAPSFEKVVHRRLADVALTDHVDALVALTGKHPDLDLGRVAVRGTGLGGWLAALAVLRRPEVFRCAVVHRPVTDWTRLHTAFAERYLGLPDDVPNGGDVYAHHSVLEVAAEAPRGAHEARPLLLTMAGAGAPIEPLVAVLQSSGRPYELAGSGPVTLGDELDFIRRHGM